MACTSLPYLSSLPCNAGFWHLSRVGPSQACASSAIQSTLADAGLSPLHQHRERRSLVLKQFKHKHFWSENTICSIRGSLFCRMALYINSQFMCKQHTEQGQDLIRRHDVVAGPLWWCLGGCPAGPTKSSRVGRCICALSQLPRVLPLLSCYLQQASWPF
jgi:hypothetical protein